MNLVIINIAMDDGDSIFAHQKKIAECLSLYFSQTIVITRRKSGTQGLVSLEVKCVKWTEGRNLENAIRLLATFIRVIGKKRNLVIFTHMSETMAAITAPVSWFLRIKHYLWYAHKSYPFPLKIASHFLSGIITSTSGSCPVKGPKVHVIGQGIDSSIFKKSSMVSVNRLQNLFYFGRLDESKDIPSIARAAELVRLNDQRVKLLLIGDSSRTGTDDSHLLQDVTMMEHCPSWITQVPSIKRELIPNQLRNHGIFVHASMGSLDKTLIEATMLSHPVATCNTEYLSEFGSWSLHQNKQLSKAEFLAEEIRSILNLPFEELERELARRHVIAMAQHSLNGWLDRVVGILKKEME